MLNAGEVRFEEWSHSIDVIKFGDVLNIEIPIDARKAFSCVVGGGFEMPSRTEGYNLHLNVDLQDTIDGNNWMSIDYRSVAAVYSKFVIRTSRPLGARCRIQIWTDASRLGNDGGILHCGIQNCQWDHKSLSLSNVWLSASMRLFA